MLSYREIINGLKSLNIPAGQPVIAHASLSAFGEVRGGAETLLGALVSLYGRVMMPAFTYNTMLIPEEGPPDNGMEYGSGSSTNRMTEFFTPEMPADRMMGVLPETLRQMPAAQRSSHPILSFTGVGVDSALAAQTLAEPFAPIGVLAGEDGWVLLLGVNHTTNTSIHYAEKLAGRKNFIRWALTAEGVRVCPGFSGCSDGFEQITPHLGDALRSAMIGSALVQALPLPYLFTVVQQMIERDPFALLCERAECERCDAVRGVLRAAEN